MQHYRCYPCCPILLGKHREKNCSVHLAFLDLDKLSTVSHMSSYGCPRGPIEYQKNMWGGRNCFMRSLPALCGVNKQAIPCTSRGSSGFITFALLFMLCVDTITKGIQNPHLWTLLFADDIMLTSESRDDLQKQVRSWKNRLQQHGLLPVYQKLSTWSDQG
ncbi:hypothetical protein RB195_026021 [Necator americanus]|uniref:Reverse transcriptase domain-containing protein n=1 Tax=Necator americanus TaxID=51031 RepID=A0ABR1EUY6_NECAM